MKSVCVCVCVCVYIYTLYFDSLYFDITSWLLHSFDTLCLFNVDVYY